MEMKGNVVAFPSIYFVWVGLVLSSLLFRLQHLTVLDHLPDVGRCRSSHFRTTILEHQYARQHSADTGPVSIPP